MYSILACISADGLFSPKKIMLPITTNLLTYLSSMFCINKFPSILDFSLLLCVFIRPVNNNVKYLFILQFKCFHNMHWCLLVLNQTSDK